jgi:surfeit locus 1 family protein
MSPAPRARSRVRLIVLTVCAGLLFAGFAALGTWQLKRRLWKLDLIERVEQRVHAQPAAAPGPERWPQVSADADEYRHVRVSGVFLYTLTTRVQAATELGSGFWLLTPLRSADGGIVLVNRGFVPAGASSSASSGADGAEASAPGVSVVTGLLRMTEPGGGFLRSNDPVADRWYSRDVQAIAVARGLSGEHVAPYFVDQDAGGGSSPGHPVGGLTVIAFHNSHLVYALTWYALSLMAAGACFLIVRSERRGADRIARNSDDK